MRLSKKAAAEFIGTFGMVFAGCGSVMVAQRFPGTITASTIPMVFGLAVATMIYAVGHIKGTMAGAAIGATLAGIAYQRIRK